MDQPKIDRILRLMMLLTSHIDYSIEELAEKLETSTRSIYRYIDTFKSAGFAVIKQNNTYKLAKESKFFKEISQLVHFTEEEAFMVHKVIDAFDETNIVKQNLKSKLASIYNYTAITEMVVKKNNLSNVNKLSEAINEKKRAMLKDYRSAHSHKIEDRVVEPFAFTSNYINVWCYDISDNSNKLFKTERIGDVIVLNDAQSFEDKHNSGYMDVFRMHGDSPIPIELELGTLAYNLLIEEYPLAEKDITKVGKNRWRLKTNMANPRGVGRFVIGTLDDIKIIKCEELKAYIASYSKKYLHKFEEKS